MTSLPSAPPLAATLAAMGLAPAIGEPLAGHLPRLTLQPGQPLLAQGAMQESAFYLERGIARACHYARDGQERCKEFYFEGELCLLYDSWLTGSPARYQLEAVTALQLVRVPLALLDEPTWQPVCMALLRQQLCYKERKEAFLLLHSPRSATGSSAAPSPLAGAAHPGAARQLHRHQPGHPVADPPAH